MKNVYRFLLIIVFSITYPITADAGAPQLRYKQYHLFFHVVDGPQGPMVAAQEIVVLMSDGDRVSGGADDPTFSFSLPEGASGLDLLEVPPMMGEEARRTPMLTAAQVKIEPNRLTGFAPIRTGKNSYSYGYVLPVENGRALWKKRLDYDADLMVSFVPKIARVSSKALNVEAVESGFKVIGTGLARGAEVDLQLDGIESAAPAASPAAPSGIDDPANAFMLAVVLGLSLAALAAGVALAARRRRGAGEIESLARALERGEVTQEYFLRRLRELLAKN